MASHFWGRFKLLFRLGLYYSVVLTLEEFKNKGGRGFGVHEDSRVVFESDKHTFLYGQFQINSLLHRGNQGS